MVVVAGTPGSGKTSVLMHAVKDLIRAGAKPALVKIDCMWTEDDVRFKRLGLPVAVGLSKDMCPDHYAIYNVDEMLAWAKVQSADILLNETAGLCLRCAPYPDRALAICVIDVTTGPNSPLKVGPLLTTASPAGRGARERRAPILQARRKFMRSVIATLLAMMPLLMGGQAHAEHPVHLLRREEHERRGVGGRDRERFGLDQLAVKRELEVGPELLGRDAPVKVAF